jgi:predicted  nucleic acid-binding Zn-ribbon protein
MSDARNQLTSLLKIQELALEIQAAKAVVDGAPAKIEEAESRFRERNAEYVEIKERYDAIEADRASRSAELSALEESRQHYQDSLMQVQNQREYAAALKEIDSVKARIGITRRRFSQAWTRLRP